LELLEAISLAPTPCPKESSTHTGSKINIAGQMKLTPSRGLWVYRRRQKIHKRKRERDIKK
jgi:hypothetical protein